MSANIQIIENKIIEILKNRLEQEHPKISFLIPRLSDFHYSSELYIETLFYLAQSQLDENNFCEYLSEIGSLAIKENSVFLLEMTFEKLSTVSQEKQNYQKPASNSYLKLGELCLKSQVCFNWSLYLKAAIKQFDYLNNKVKVSQAELILGKFYLKNSRLFEAEMHLERAYNQSSTLMDPEINSEIEFILGKVYFLLEKYDFSKSFFSCALINYFRKGNIPKIIETNNYLILLHINSNNIHEALNLIDKNLSLNKKQSNSHAIAFGYISKSLIYALNNDLQLSLIFSNLAKKICENTSYNFDSAEKLNDAINSGHNKEKLMILYKDLLVKSNKVA